MPLRVNVFQRSRKRIKRETAADRQVIAIPLFRLQLLEIAGSDDSFNNCVVHCCRPVDFCYCFHYIDSRLFVALYSGRACGLSFIQCGDGRRILGPPCLPSSRQELPAAAPWGAPRPSRPSRICCKTSRSTHRRAIPRALRSSSRSCRKTRSTSSSEPPNHSRGRCLLFRMSYPLGYQLLHFRFDEQDPPRPTWTDLREHACPGQAHPHRLPAEPQPRGRLLQRYQSWFRLQVVVWICRHHKVNVIHISCQKLTLRAEELGRSETRGLLKLSAFRRNGRRQCLRGHAQTVIALCAILESSSSRA